MLQINLASPGDYPRVRDFYYDLIDGMRNAEYRPGWEKDIYPSHELLQTALERSELYLGERDGEIISCMVFNHEYNEGYKKIKWSLDAKDEELMVIHALGVRTDCAGRGVAKQMVRKAFELAAARGVKTIRLDVLEGNLPAEKAYTGLGFRYLDTISMYYEDTGWTNFKVYEYIL